LCVSRSLLRVSRSLLCVSRSLLCVSRSLLCVSTCPTRAPMLALHNQERLRGQSRRARERASERAKGSVCERERQTERRIPCRGSGQVRPSLPKHPRGPCSLAESFPPVCLCVCFCFSLQLAPEQAHPHARDTPTPIHTHKTHKLLRHDHSCATCRRTQQKPQRQTQTSTHIQTHRDTC